MLTSAKTCWVKKKKKKSSRPLAARFHSRHHCGTRTKLIPFLKGSRTSGEPRMSIEPTRKAEASPRTAFRWLTASR